jgi:hypothetical protein
MCPVSYPKLMQIVLKRGPCDKHAVPRVENADDLRQHRVFVLDTMGFVDDDVLPSDFLEVCFFHQASFIRGDTDFKVDGSQSRFNQIHLIIQERKKEDECHRVG